MPLELNALFKVVLRDSFPGGFSQFLHDRLNLSIRYNLED